MYPDNIYSVFFFFQYYSDHQDLHSFPTRRSSDLHQVIDNRGRTLAAYQWILLALWVYSVGDAYRVAMIRRAQKPSDRKSTRLNSSHVEISYAVFCLKKKK